MRRTSAVRGLALAVAVLSAFAATVGPAGAEIGTPPGQDQPSSTWVQPRTGPLDGLGTFLYVAAPAPRPTQGSPLGYEYTFSFRFEDQTLGLLALGAQQGRKVAGFGLLPGQLVATVPFEWSFGGVYFLYTRRLDATHWAAWVLDVRSGSWTFIAQQEAPAGAGGITSNSTTAVDYDATLAPSPTADTSTCAFYPRVDAYFFAPIGWRGANASVATLAGNGVVNGECPSTTSPLFLWQHYRLGTTTAA